MIADQGDERETSKAVLEVLALCFAYSLAALYFESPNIFLRTEVLALSASLIWLTAVDLKHLEIPDLASLVVAVVGLLMSGGGSIAAVVSLAEGAAVASVLAGASHVAWMRTGREWLGLGDAKLIGAGTIVVGIDNLWIVLVIACCGGIVVGLLGRGRRARRELPFGPFLAYAIFVTFLSAGCEA